MPVVQELLLEPACRFDLTGTAVMDLQRCQCIHEVRLLLPPQGGELRRACHGVLRVYLHGTKHRGIGSEAFVTRSNGLPAATPDVQPKRKWQVALPREVRPHLHGQ